MSSNNFVLSIFIFKFENKFQEVYTSHKVHFLLFDLDVK